MPTHLYHCDLPLRRPVSGTTGTIDRRTSWVLVLEAEGGLTGLGEAAPLPGFGGEAHEVCERALRRALELLRSEVVSRFVQHADPARPLEPALEEALAGAPCARTAVECALVDLAAQLRGVPVAEYLAPGAPRSIPLNALVDGVPDTPWAVAAGFRTLKCKAPSDPDIAATLLAQLAEVAGPSVRLRLDVNGMWTSDQCLRFAEAAPLECLDYLEQPLPATDLLGAAALRTRLGLPIALDESVRSAADVGRIGGSAAADAVVLKPMFLGGWRPVRQAVALAQAYGLEVVTASVLDGAIGRTYAAHIAAAAGLTERAHGLATGDRLIGDLTSEPLMPEQGTLRLRDRPGLGIGVLRG